jgi:hypothetical protein
MVLHVYAAREGHRKPMLKHSIKCETLDSCEKPLAACENPVHDPASACNREAASTELMRTRDLSTTRLHPTPQTFGERTETHRLLGSYVPTAEDREIPREFKQFCPASLNVQLRGITILKNVSAGSSISRRITIVIVGRLPSSFCQYASNVALGSASVNPTLKPWRDQ